MAWEGKIDWLRLWPRYWFQNEPTDWEWDAMLNELLDKYTPEPLYLTAKLGPVVVWVANFPYSYGNPYKPHEVAKLPSVATRKRLKAAIPKEDPLAAVRELVTNDRVA